MCSTAKREIGKPFGRASGGEDDVVVHELLSLIPIPRGLRQTARDDAGEILSAAHEGHQIQLLKAAKVCPQHPLVEVGLGALRLVRVKDRHDGRTIEDGRLQRDG